MYAYRNIAALFFNRCCIGKASICAVYIVEKHVTVTSIKLLSVTHKWVFDESNSKKYFGLQEKVFDIFVQILQNCNFLYRFS